MPPLDFSSEDLIIAWAAQVSLPQLVSSVLAYVGNKAAVTTLRLAAKNTSIRPLRNLPEEMILRIIDSLRDMTFRDNMKKWIQYNECINDKCTSSWYAAQGWSREDAWEHIHRELTANRLKFMKAARVFFQDFGIRPHAIISRTFFEGKVVKMDAKTYLILPAAAAPVKYSLQAHTAVEVFVNSVLDPSALGPLSDAGRDKFKIAAQILKLHPYDAEEDESVYADKPRITELAPSSPSNVLNKRRILKIKLTTRVSKNQTQNKDLKPQLRIFGVGVLEFFED